MALLRNFTNQSSKAKNQNSSHIQTRKEDKTRTRTMFTMPHTRIRPRDSFGESPAGRKPLGSKSTNPGKPSGNLGLSKVFSGTQCSATTISESVDNSKMWEWRGFTSVAEPSEIEQNERAEIPHWEPFVGRWSQNTQMNPLYQRWKKKPSTVKWQQKNPNSHLFSA